MTYEELEKQYEAAMEDGYKMYKAQVEAYEKLIELEDDPVRKAGLEMMLADVHEENK